MIPLASPAVAAETFQLDLPAQSPATAVTAIATAMRISVGGVSPDLCGAKVPPIIGRFTPQAALAAALGNGRCTFDRVDDKTFRIRLRPVPSPPAPRQSGPPPPATAPTTVLVTARRRIEPLTSARADVSVISGDALGDDDLSLQAVARQSAGMTVTNLGPGRDKIFLRGQSDGILTGRTQSTVGLYLDDLPITFNAPDPDLELVDMKRVEVLQGPQGALYGQGSISGIVRLVTNPADPTRVSGNIEAGAGVARSTDTSTNLSSVLNLPLLSHQAALRLVAYRDEVGGYINDIGLPRDKINRTMRYGGRAAFRWIVAPAWTLDLGYATQEIATRNSQYVDGNRGAFTRDLHIAEPHDNDFSDVSGTLTGAFPAGLLKLSVSRLDHRVVSTYDATGLGAPIAQATDLFSYNEDQHFGIWALEVTFVSRRQDRFEWLAGAFAAESEETFAPQLRDLSSNTTAYAEWRHDRVTSLAGFGELTYHLTSRLTLTTGARLSYTGHNTNSLHVLPTLALHLPRQSLADTHVSPELSIQYRLDNGLLIYAQSAEGYRDAGFNTTYLASPATPAQYQGDDLDNYEIGARFHTPDDRFGLSAAAFSTVWRNIQSDQFQSSGLPVTVNIGNGTVKGLDFDADWAFAPNLRLHAVGQLSDASVNHATANYLTDEAAGLPFIAPESVDLAIHWNRPVGQAQVHAVADIAFRSVTHLNFGRFQNVTMDGYATLNLATEIRLKSTTVSLRIDNAGDITGNSFAYGNPFSLKSTPQITPNRPRTFWAMIKKSF